MRRDVIHLNIQQLKYFDGICKWGSFSKTAKNLYISPQGLSMAIMRLEDEFSCRLFQRNSNGVVLTPEGEFLRDHVRNILSELEECERFFASQKAVMKTISLGCVYGCLSEFAVGVIQDFEELHSNIKISVTEYPSIPCDQALDDGSVELAFNVGPVDTEKYEAIPVFPVRLCLVVNDRCRTFSSLGTDTITEDMLPMIQKVPMVTVDKNFKTPAMFLDYCAQRSITPEVKVRVGEVIGVHRIVSTNPGLVGLTTETVANALPMPHVVSYPLECPGLAWTVYLVYKRDTLMPPAAQSFVNYIKAQINDN